MNHNFDPNKIDAEVNSGPGGTWRGMLSEEIEMINQPIVAWSAWLNGDRIYMSDRHEWSDVPQVGMQVLMLYLGDGKRAIFKNRDEYYLPGSKGKKLGLMIDYDEYDTITTNCMKLFYDPEQGVFFVK
jgi:hypothetical protein